MLKNKPLHRILFFTAGLVLFYSFSQPPCRFPYRQGGLSEQEAAAHLLNRFSFGATPGQVDAVVKMGPEAWFAAQLKGNLPDDTIEKKLAGLEALRMSNTEIVQTYPKAGQVLRMAVQDGVIERDSVAKDKKEYKDNLKKYLQQKGLKPQSELLRQLPAQKILRAAYSNNQLHEVLTDFWFNHFNVAAGNGVQQFILSYERDAIRPNVAGSFEALLLATAKSPAMLLYLNNTKSSVNSEAMSPAQQRLQAKRQEQIKNPGKIKKPAQQGLNENYARELMELHTLGVDGGYTQTDVTEAARVLTGWRVNPLLEYNAKPKVQPDSEQAKKRGFVYDDNFLFAANKHDQGAKTVLGKTFPPGGGYSEGEALIHLLATHASTAQFISRKLAVRFVSDAPPQTLIDKMAQTFSTTHGNIKEVLTAMVCAPEFWSSSAIRTKTKSPFELAISAVRSTSAQVAAPQALYQWIAKMGQPLYNYQAPTGFPDRGAHWINTGSLLNRMNFGLAFASGRIAGTSINLLALNNNREPESAPAALQIYGKLLLPGRNLDETVKRLTPMLADPELVKKVDDAADKTTNSLPDDFTEDAMPETFNASKAANESDAISKPSTADKNRLMQVVGVILGSPEFQRR